MADWLRLRSRHEERGAALIEFALVLMFHLGQPGLARVRNLVTDRQLLAANQPGQCRNQPGLDRRGDPVQPRLEDRLPLVDRISELGRERGHALEPAI